MTPSNSQFTGRELPDGLATRPMQTSDLDAVAEFVTRVFGTVMKSLEPDLMAGIWARELLRGDHPTTRPEDGTLVVERESGKIVACGFLISQTWQYDEIRFAVGRPELIASDPEYRGRGLIRELLTDLHARSVTLNHQMQALTGIPYYYRQYGYEPALISESIHQASISSLPATSSGMQIRPANASDISFITSMYERAMPRVLVSAVRDDPIWRHELLARDPAGDYWHELRIVERASGAPIGFVAYVAQLRGGAIVCTVAELTDDAAWEEMAPLILSHLRDAGEKIAARTGAACDYVELDVTPDHPFVRAAGDSMIAVKDSFAWYVRMQDIPAFIRGIAPVLERRLAASPRAGHSGDVTMTFYPHGLKLGFESGRLTMVETFPNAPHRTVDVAIPGRSFIQMLLGSRSMDDLERAFPFEAFTRSETARDLLAILFPKRPSSVWPVA